MGRCHQPQASSIEVLRLRQRVCSWIATTALSDCSHRARVDRIVAEAFSIGAGGREWLEPERPIRRRSAPNSR